MIKGIRDLPNKLKSLRFLCLVCIGVSTLLLSACHHHFKPKLQVSSSGFPPGKILLLPPRDVVQKGVPHPRGEGSGSTFEKFMKINFAGSEFDLTTTNNPDFNNWEIAKKKAANKEASELGADYFLQVVLGEFTDATPVPYNYQSDYVTMKSAIMYDTSSGKVVWSLDTPYVIKRSNFGTYNGLLERHARVLSEKIIGTHRIHSAENPPPKLVELKDRYSESLQNCQRTIREEYVKDLTNLLIDMRLAKEDKNSIDTVREELIRVQNQVSD